MSVGTQPQLVLSGCVRLTVAGIEHVAEQPAFFGPHVEVDNLATRVDAGVGAAGHRERHLVPGDLIERTLELALHGPPSRLGGPPGEPAAVVLDQEPGGQGSGLGMWGTPYGPFSPLT